MSVVVVKLIGGLGNQMFQYAAGLALAERLGVPLKLDVSGFLEYNLRKFELSNLSITAEIANQKDLDLFNLKSTSSRKSVAGLARKWFGKKQYLPYPEPHFQFDYKFKELTGPVYLDGYWQSMRYFSEIADTVRKEFTVRVSETDRNCDVEQQIKQSESAVSVHVRRGDYASNPVVTQFHGLCHMDYYRKAMIHIQDKWPEAKYFVFTDDPAWVAENFPSEFSWQLVKTNNADSGWLDMRLMSMCRHHIIANSSFSWWGAWLGGNSEKVVVAPKNWFANAPHDTSDLLPPDWKKI